MLHIGALRGCREAGVRSSRWLGERWKVTRSLTHLRSMVRRCRACRIPTLRCSCRSRATWGNKGRLRELVELIAPRFRVQSHGLLVGNNLLKAYLELGMFEDARRVLTALFALNRPDYRDTLAFWEKELDDRRRGFGPIEDAAKPSVSLMPYAGIVWAREKEGLAALLPHKAEGVPAVAVMAASCTVASPTEVPVVQRTNVEGGLSRALTLALVEAVHVETTAQGVALIPVAHGEGAGGFVLANQPWDDAQVVAVARGHGPSMRLAANLHVDATQSRWLAAMTVLRVADGAVLERVDAHVDAASPLSAVTALGAALSRHALTLSGVQPQSRPAWASLPVAGKRASLMAACEQVLAVQFAALHEGPRVGLYGPRSIVDGLFGACLDAPTSAPWRMLLLTALSRLQDIEPAVVAEYRERLARLQEQHPVAGEAGAAVEKLTQAIGAR